MDLRDIKFVLEAHSRKAKTESSKFRKWDNRTLYYIHPIWCATMILHETSLPQELRENGSVALLYHDVLEDTNATLPKWLNSEVKRMVEDMTFNNSMEEREKIWEKDSGIKLLKLFDKVGNMLDGVWMNNEKAKIHKEFLKKLTDDVSRTYGDLNIVKLAKTFI